MTSCRAAYGLSKWMSLPGVPMWGQCFDQPRQCQKCGGSYDYSVLQFLLYRWLPARPTRISIIPCDVRVSWRQVYQSDATWCNLQISALIASNRAIRSILFPSSQTCKGCRGQHHTLYIALSKDALLPIRLSIVPTDSEGPKLPLTRGGPEKTMTQRCPVEWRCWPLLGWRWLALMVGRHAQGDFSIPDLKLASFPRPCSRDWEHLIGRTMSRLAQSEDTTSNPHSEAPLWRSSA